MSENDYDLTGKRAALYVRVSTDEQARDGLSLDEQEYTLKQYAHEHGATIVGIYRDEGTTARKQLKSRKELQRLLQDVNADQIDVILFIKVDRWFRNTGDFYKVQEILDAHQVKWIATQENYNTTTSNGLLMLNLRLAIAQNESDRTSDRIKFVFEGKKRRHESLGALPTGYKTKSKNDKTIVIDESTAGMIRDIFSHYLSSQSIHETMLYSQNKYSKPKSYDGVKKILKNKRYIGTFYGIKNYAPAIIDLDTWNKVQYIIAQPRRMEAPRRNYPYLFAGLIHCPECNGMLLGHSTPRYSHGKLVSMYRHYLCGKHLIHAQCTFKTTIRESEIESFLLANLQGLIVSYQMSLSHPHAIDKRVQRVKDSLERLKDLYVTGCIDRATYDHDFMKYNADLQRVQEQQEPPTKEMPKKLITIMDKGISYLYNGLTTEGKRSFWHSIIRSIYIKNYNPKANQQREYTVVFL